MSDKYDIESHIRGTGTLFAAASADYTWRLRIVPAAPAPGRYDYLAPSTFCSADGGPPLGAFVTIPFGGRDVIGVVWEQSESADAFTGKIKAVKAALDLPPMRPEMRRFLERAAAYTLTPLGEMVRLATRAPKLDEPPPVRKVIVRGTAELSNTTQTRIRALEAFDSLAAADANFYASSAQLARSLGVGAGVLKALIADRALEERLIPKDPPYQQLDPQHARKPLSTDQVNAAKQFRDSIAWRSFKAHLLHGVTGSGKTEAYLEAVAECLRAGRQALVLLPEIALTEAFLRRLTDRFGGRPAEWHSAAKGSERRRCWRAVATGRAQVVVGARSALFLPFRDLGLIVVDEEHDGGYKQEEGAIYNARDMAVLRAQTENAVIILASATPSLESWTNAGQNPHSVEPPRYAYARLPKRFGPAIEPEIATIDLRDDKLPLGRWISSSLQEDIEHRIDVGEQALLFLNRRGYAPLTICRSCGERLGCPHCESWLVLHRAADRVMCHLCGFSQCAPSACPSCKKATLAACGPGVERLAEEAAAIFPSARIGVVSSDLAPSPSALKESLDVVAAGGVDIVIGTQIMAKGHNFPNMTLVGVVDADLGLQGGDFRAAEKTFQLLRQVSGRSGRAEKPGKAVLQTVAPEHPVMKALVAGDEIGFLSLEAERRRQAQSPPYGRYLSLIFSGKDERQVLEFGAAYQRLAEPMRAIGAVVLGPAPAPISRIRGRFRARILVKAARGAPLQSAAKAWMNAVARAKLPGRGAVHVAFDVDPISFL